METSNCKATFVVWSFFYYQKIKQAPHAAFSVDTSYCRLCKWSFENLLYPKSDIIFCREDRSLNSRQWPCCIACLHLVSSVHVIKFGDGTAVWYHIYNSSMCIYLSCRDFFYVGRRVKSAWSTMHQQMKQLHEYLLHLTT